MIWFCNTKYIVRKQDVLSKFEGRKSFFFVKKFLCFLREIFEWIFCWFGKCEKLNKYFLSIMNSRGSHFFSCVYSVKHDLYYFEAF